MTLPDKNRAMRMVVEVPVLDNTTGEWQKNIRKFVHATNNSAAEVVAAGYFNFARDKGRIRVGDRCEIYADVDGTQDTIHVRFATVPATGNVTTVVDTAASGA